MIVGQEILDRGLITGGTAANLKNSTYDLTVGDIIPIGKKAIRARRTAPTISPYYLQRREMVWVLSKEEFHMPSNITGLATLRTTFTKQGILALNVGIIDPFFSGPISTALINFSDRPRRIDIGDKFFRVAFLEHDDVRAYRPRDENVNRAAYVKHLEDVSYSEFSRSFLNIPEFDEDFYVRRFWRIIGRGLWNYWRFSIPLFAFMFLIMWYLLETGLWTFVVERWDSITGLVKRIWFVS
jgi:deoxycytidine triphosphate deaminase